MAANCTKHDTCEILSKAGIKNVVAALFNKYNGKLWTVLVGQERDGTYNFIAGKVDKKDDGCYLKALKRELKEEAKLDFSDWKKFDAVFKNTAGLRYYLTPTTAIFVGEVHGLSRTPLNKQIAKDNADQSMPKCCQELLCVDWLIVETQKQLEGKDIKLCKHVPKYIEHAFKQL